MSLTSFVGKEKIQLEVELNKLIEKVNDEIESVSGLALLALEVRSDDWSIQSFS